MGSVQTSEFARGSAMPRYGAAPVASTRGGGANSGVRSNDTDHRNVTQNGAG